MTRFLPLKHAARIRSDNFMQRFDVRLDNKGKVLIPKAVMDNVRGQKLVMVFDGKEIRIMPKTMYRNMLEA